MDENRENTTVEAEVEESETEQETTPKTEGGSSDLGSIIGLVIILAIILCVAFYWTYQSGKSNGIERTKLTKDIAYALIEDYFTPSEARAIEYEINNMHYDLYQSTFSDTVDLIIHKDHYSRGRKSCEHEDEDIEIIFSLSFVTDDWHITKYTWPNHNTCGCDVCTCGEPTTV
ncbi:MAG: hypothetical protein NC114_06315 [Ruminococcus flavefaciens]|nr:hypothetical protein [Ruminococcus flavefaciens]